GVGAARARRGVVRLTERAWTRGLEHVGEFVVEDVAPPGGAGSEARPQEDVAAGGDPVGRRGLRGGGGVRARMEADVAEVVAEAMLRGCAHARRQRRAASR